MGSQLSPKAPSSICADSRMQAPTSSPVWIPAAPSIARKSGLTTAGVAVCSDWKGAPDREAPGKSRQAAAAGESSDLGLRKSGGKPSQPVSLLRGYPESLPRFSAGTDATSGTEASVTKAPSDTGRTGVRPAVEKLLLIAASNVPSPPTSAPDTALEGLGGS